jgi:DNA-binding response OmpR family regulator
VVRKLEALKCDHVQGYYISQPLPAVELIRWMKECSWETPLPVKEIDRPSDMRKVLVIDDDHRVREIVREFMQLAGYEVQEAEEGNAGLEICRREPFGIVITDIVMPGKEGLETIMDLRREHPGIVILAISGGGRVHPDMYLEMAEDMGADAVLKKPFSSKELYAAVEQAVKARKALG